MKIKRSCGLLLHVTSLPGAYGIGTLGREAYEFIDQLREGGQRFWQILPVGPVSSFFGFSPYSSSSTFAGNPLFISIETLQQEGWLSADIIGDIAVDTGSGYVDFEGVLRQTFVCLRRAFESFKKNGDQKIMKSFSRFCETHRWWLEDFALFTALAHYHGSFNWQSWPPAVAGREPAALKTWRQKLAEEIGFQQFVQFVFFSQWQRLRRYARQEGIRIIGDLPIYVTMDSADVWANRDIFHLDRDTGKPLAVAGVPPDYFSKTGQRWGNPLYRWFEGKSLKPETLRWWQHRLQHLLKMVDVVRIDHFRAFEAYWAIPAGEKTAVKGEWLPGPGAAFFDYLKQELGHLPVIAEDLGMITPAVEKLRDDFGLPGMKVLQFAFDGNRENPYQPHNFKTRHCIVYTGTHDNNTSRGWFFGPETDEEQRERILGYMGIEGEDEFHWHFIRLALDSVADLAVIPVQDILGLGEEDRMNFPGQAERNWAWKLKPGQLGGEALKRLKHLCQLYKRV
jgi:4-alpha-glucanotransferase